MNELSRHGIHITEVLEATIGTFLKIQEQQRRVYVCLPAEISKTYQEQAQEYVSFQLLMIQNMLLRSKSSYERLKTETTVVTLPMVSSIKCAWNLPGVGI
jgi:hypothetical protein